MKYFKTFLIFFLTGLLLTTCSDGPTNSGENRKISLELVDVALNYFWLKVNIDPEYVGYQIRFYKDGDFNRSIYPNEMTKPDTVVRIYRQIKPASTYTFHAAIVDSNAGPDLFLSNSINITTLAPGPLEVSWQVDTVGVWQTSLNGVWGSSPQDVYVVGFIPTDERELPYNVIHWDGQRWKYIDYVVGEPLAAYGFAPDDVWIVGDDGGFKDLISHWDGHEWQTWETQQYDVLTSIWGTSSQNLHAVGLGGLILHYDGKTWTKMESGTSIPLRDIHGFGDKLYIVGGESANNEGILLELRKGKWKIIYNDAYPPNPIGGYGTTVWNANEYFSLNYLAPNFNVKLDTSIYQYGYAPRWINKIRGTGFNNYFIVGTYGTIEHSNGVDRERAPFYSYPDVTTTMRDLMVFDNAVFVVGYTSGRGTIFRGTF